VAFNQQDQASNFMKIELNGYKKLLTEVQKSIQKTEKNIVESVNRQKILMSWEVGKIIEKHLSENKQAEYGKKLLTQLAKDTPIKERALYQMRAFYKAYPTLPKNENDLSWSHYRSLASVKNEETRQYLEDLSVENHLEANELQKEISKTKPRATKVVPQKIAQLTCKRGKLFTYKIATLRDGEKISVDCGFNIFTEVKTSLKAEEIVESVKKGEGFSLKKSATKPEQMHTYKAYLDRVVDGDTLHVTLDLGFKIEHREILRLAKINAPEFDTVDGKLSGEALRKILKDVPFLIIKTNKTDIYGRYIADVFFSDSGETSAQKVADQGIYLNQLLLDRRLVWEY
jgi:endonuclease YncB( thermonuclease family)